MSAGGSFLLAANVVNTATCIVIVRLVEAVGLKCSSTGRRNNIQGCRLHPPPTAPQSGSINVNSAALPMTHCGDSIVVEKARVSYRPVLSHGKTLHPSADGTYGEPRRHLGMVVQDEAFNPGVDFALNFVHEIAEP